ncbi:DUF4248 domain-containing protein [Bacteroides sedimenti]|uniref:DUF4248 domain-containing protein n=1 Tax=Bacteroides sedimenti TaxID=2136147 RepID=A0ABN6Z3P7_9BACE
MKKEENEFRVRAIGKSDLAMLYNPHMSVREALRLLTRWMRRNEGLWCELQELGYRKSCKILTPREVEVITRHLGEP